MRAMVAVTIYSDHTKHQLYSIMHVLQILKVHAIVC